MNPGRKITVWYDAEGDYLEVIFERRAGYFRETENDRIMERVDESGNLLGFSILNARGSKNLSVSSFPGKSEEVRPRFSPPFWLGKNFSTSV